MVKHTKRRWDQLLTESTTTIAAPGLQFFPQKTHTGTCRSRRKCTKILRIPSPETGEYGHILCFFFLSSKFSTMNMYYFYHENIKTLFKVQYTVADKI